MGSIDNLSTSSNEHQNSENPLVSIIVITYNSAEYVLETLDSAKAQTYNNIELIISDDCSTDDTVLICKEWIQKNTYRFVRTELVVSVKNTGISANCNRGVHAADGEWVKFIAGDDILTNSSVEIFVKWIENTREDSKILFGNCEKILGGKQLNTIEIPPNTFTSGDVKEQFRYLIQWGNTIQGPTSFINRKTLIDIGLFDERIPLSEDWPLWIKATDHGFKLHYVNEVVAYYRVHEDGIYSKTLLGRSFDSKLRQSVNFIRKLYLLPLLKRENLLLDYWHIFLILNKENNSSNKFKHAFYYLMQVTDIRAINGLIKRFVKF